MIGIIKIILTVGLVYLVGCACVIVTAMTITLVRDFKDEQADS
jgi:hypothetical protein